VTKNINRLGPHHVDDYNLPLERWTLSSSNMCYNPHHVRTMSIHIVSALFWLSFKSYTPGGHTFFQKLTETSYEV